MSSEDTDPVVKQPKLASQEDITDEAISAVPKSTFLDDPVFEPLKSVLGFRIRQLHESLDIEDEDTNVPLLFEIKNIRKNLHYVAKKKLGDMTVASCHDGRRGCNLVIETSQGEPVMELEGFPGYSGLEQMKVTHGDDLVGEIIQNYDCCSSCNPQYTVYDANGEELLHIAVLDGGFFCGIFGVKKFIIISGNKEMALGEIDNESQQIRPWNRKLMADERKPLSDLKIVLVEQIELAAKILLIAAAFTINFHDTVFRFKKREEYMDFEAL
ncbi:unnamed protein product [Allacma fusca]|uniref:Phospholipid scramblase n=1 Tax=Allacma fusca TaxID=39272 RepID=A0A8J2NZG2_9HEXA|nr:unnamed protein product [Allacma fusca]